jgi:hypothetical protein
MDKNLNTYLTYNMIGILDLRIDSKKKIGLSSKHLENYHINFNLIEKLLIWLNRLRWNFNDLIDPTIFIQTLQV